MTKKKSEEEKVNENEKVLEKTCVDVLEFWELCKLLFAETDETPYRMNDLKEANKFYNEAVAMAEELGIDWKGMSDSESNRIMINMLADRYDRIGDACTRKCKIEISVLLCGGEGKVAIKEGGENA